MRQQARGSSRATRVTAPYTDVRAKESAESRERTLARKRGTQRAATTRHLVGGEIAFRLLADSVRDFAIFLADPNGVITYWGKGAQLMKGWTREQAEGAHLRLLYPDGGAEDGTAEAHLRTATETGEYAGEGTRVRADGSTFWAGLTLTAIRDEHGKLLGFTKVARDLTAKRAEAAAAAKAATAEHARLAAEEANRAMSRFLTTMSHEIRTPINAVIGYVGLLEDQVGGGALNDKQRLFVERLRLSSEHLAALVDEILDLSRLNADRVPLERAIVHLDLIVRRALALVEPQATAKGLVLVDQVGASGAVSPSCGDGQRVQQVLVNVLANAVKFTERRDSVAGRITVSTGMAEEPPRGAEVHGTGPWVWVKIEDTGRGIAPEQLAAIFEPFTQLDAHGAGAPTGTGLGLTISRRVARLMGGDLTVESTLGVGSSFRLWLPVAESDPPSCDANGPSSS